MLADFTTSVPAAKAQDDAKANANAEEDTSEEEAEVVEEKDDAKASAEAEPLKVPAQVVGGEAHDLPGEVVAHDLLAHVSPVVGEQDPPPSCEQEQEGGGSPPREEMPGDDGEERIEEREAEALIEFLATTPVSDPISPILNKSNDEKHQVCRKPINPTRSAKNPDPKTLTLDPEPGRGGLRATQPASCTVLATSRGRNGRGEHWGR